MARGDTGRGRPRLERSKTCPRCGIEFTPGDWRNTFCSRRCAHLKDHPTKPCAHCGEAFAKSNEDSHSRWMARKYCSNRCKGAGRTKTIGTCRSCGGPTNPMHPNRPYCCQACYWLDLRTERYPVRNRRIGMEFTRPMKRELLARAGGCCQGCGATEHLQFDHVIPLFLGGTNDVSNGQVLCRTCHRAKTTAELRAAA